MKDCAICIQKNNKLLKENINASTISNQLTEPPKSPEGGLEFLITENILF